MAIHNPVTICTEDSGGESESMLSRGGGVPSTDTGFKPSSYDANLTMDATGEALALATGVALGAGRVQVANLGATTEAIRVAFGTSEVNALANLTIVTNAATTGVYMGAAADLGSQSIQILGVPALATHIAAGPAVAADTQDVAITQGV